MGENEMEPCEDAKMGGTKKKCNRIRLEIHSLTLFVGE
jgi:hypothetical protein